MTSRQTNSKGSFSGSQPPANEPKIITGWEHTTYAHNSDRYIYIGKDDDTREPQWIDQGPKGGRSGKSSR